MHNENHANKNSEISTILGQGAPSFTRHFLTETAIYTSIVARVNRRGISLCSFEFFLFLSVCLGHGTVHQVSLSCFLSYCFVFFGGGAGSGIAESKLSCQNPSRRKKGAALPCSMWVPRCQHCHIKELSHPGTRATIEVALFVRNGF